MPTDWPSAKLLHQSRLAEIRVEADAAWENPHAAFGRDEQRRLRPWETRAGVRSQDECGRVKS